MLRVTALVALIGWAPAAEVCGDKVCLTAQDASRVHAELARIPHLRAESDALREVVRLQDIQIRTATATLAMVDRPPWYARSDIVFVVGVVAGGLLAVGLVRSMR